MRALLGFRDGLYGLDTRRSPAVRSLFAGIQPLSVAIDPDVPARIYCASYDRGLWRSEDEGETWRPMGTPQSYFGPTVTGTIDTRKTTVVTIDPELASDGGRALWVGTEPSRLYRSTDHGETFACVSPLDLPSRPRWSFPPRPDTHHVQCIAVGRNGRVHVAVEAGAMLLGRDGGRTFDDRRPGSPIDAHVLLTHPLAPGRLYAALGDALLTPGRSFAESRDDGDSWRYLGRGLEAMPYLYGLALNPADPDDMCVAAAPGPQAAHVAGGSSIFRRQGDSWKEEAEGLPRDGLVPVVAAARDDPGGWFALSDHGLFAKASGAAGWSLVAASPSWRGIHPTTVTLLAE